MFRRVYIIFVLLLILPVCGLGQEEQTLPTVHPFRMGFLRSDEDQALGVNWYESLKKFLLDKAPVREELEKNHYSGISVLPADGYRDMLQRMDVSEFDLAFCSSVIFVQQEGDYRPILQLRWDIFDSRRQGMTLRKGVIITGAGSPLFKMDMQKQETIRDYVRSHPMAFVSAHNAVGYVYPRLSLWRKYGVFEPADYIFCGSSEEVVKYVVSGLVDIGACDRQTFETVLKRNCPQEPPENLAAILLETSPAPTSPIVIRSSLHPRKSKLGRVLKGALKVFYNNSKHSDVPRLTDSRDENFKNLREEIAAFQSLTEKTPAPPDK